MDNAIRTAGIAVFLGGIAVLLGYFLQYNAIKKAHAEFLGTRVVFWLWASFACLAAVSYILLFVLWIGTDAFDSSGNLFLSGLATFIFGACLWPWVFLDRYAETSAIWITATGSIIMLVATTMSKDTVTMALPFTVVLAIQHVAIDGVWWINSTYRAKKNSSKFVNALYQTYYAPLFVAAVLCLVEYTNAGPIIVITVTSLHFLVGAGLTVSRASSILESVATRYADLQNGFADALITFGLALASYTLVHNSVWLTFPAILAAVLGNSFCMANNLNYTVSLRICWISALLLWVWLSIENKTWGYTLTTTVSGIIFALATVFVAKYYTRTSKINYTILSGHLLAGLFHALSSIVLSCVVWGQDKSWRAPVTRFVTSWDHVNASTSVDCTARPCYMRIDIKMLDSQLPLVDFVVAASCISASYHLLIVYKVISGADLDSTLALRWKDYSLSASLLLVVISALCGVSDMFLLVVPALVVYILLDVTPQLEIDWNGPEQPKARLASYIVLYLVAWAPTVYQFFSSWEEDPKPPDAIIAIIATLFLVYSGFIVNFVGQKGDTKERRYIFLSFLAKTTLHWLLYTGISGRSNRVYATKEEAISSGETDSGSTWWELLLSIAVPVVLGVIGYLATGLTSKQRSFMQLQDFF